MPSSTPPSDAFILTGVGGHPNRLHIPDARGQGASLRVTRHPDQRKVVLSHWRDGVCVASTPIELSEVSYPWESDYNFRNKVVLVKIGN